jgi:uncharacterized protein
MVDCAAPRLVVVERETCASPDLMRLTASVDSATRDLETKLTRRDRDALLDTERPFLGERSNCQIERPMADCIERVLLARLRALAAASRSSDVILDEVARATMIDVAYFQKWGNLLAGKRVQVYGCMAVEPGSAPAARTRGFVSSDIYHCSKVPRKYVPVVFTYMDQWKLAFYSRSPSSYWAGVVEQRDGKLVLAQVTP